jgi:fucose permease
MNQTQSAVIENGVGLGAVIAVVVSWHRNRSILWAIIHGILSWIYVIYYAITRDERS